MIRGRTVAFGDRSNPDPVDRLGEWRQSDDHPTLVHALGILNLPRTHLAVFVPVENGAEQLGSSLIESDSVGQVREVQG
jgi:hypothetical protein